MSKKVDESVIKKIKIDKNVLYDKIKYMNKWLFNPDKLKIDPLLEDKILFESNLKYRLYNNFLSLPKLIWYLNKYLNQLYDFHSFDNEQLLRTFANILKISNIKDNSYLYFSRYQTFKRDSFTKLIDKYCEEINDSLNSEEIHNLYKLFEVGIIRNEDMDDIESIIEGKSSSDSKSIKSENKSSSVKIEPTTKSNEITQFINAIIGIKVRRNPCNDCPLNKKPTVVLDTNISSLTADTPVDIAIIANETASEDDIVNQNPLTGADGIVFRTLFYKLVERHNLKYVITNASLCCPDKELTDSQLKKVLNNCKGLIDEIHSTFKPNLIIPFGDIRKNYGIKESLKDINGTIVNKRYFCMPSAKEAEVSKTSKDRFNKAITALDLHFSAQNLNRNNIKIDNQYETNFKTTQNSRLERGDTLFNVETLNDKIVYILIDINGKKKYIVEDIQFPIYIKNGTYGDCEYISDNYDSIVFLTAKQKQQLSSKLNQNIKQFIEC